MDEEKEIELVFKKYPDVELDDDVILPLEVSDEDTMDLEKIVTEVKEEIGDKNE